MSTAPIAVSTRPSQVGPPRAIPTYQLPGALFDFAGSRKPSAVGHAKGPRPEREVAITEEHLDLTVDYDSDVEDSLGTDLLVERPTREYLEESIGILGYSDNPSEFWNCYEEAKKQWTNSEIRTMLSYLRSHGIERWFKKYVMERKEPVRKLFYGFGVLLSREQRRMDDLSLVPLLKAAAFRSMRRRSKRAILAWPSVEPVKPVTLDTVAERIRDARHIVVLSGAGISVSCGIPDFRSRNGLYSQLFSSGAYDLDDPQQMFDINYFKQNPSVFYSFAHKIYPSNFTPSRCHRFIRAIEKHGKLLRNYTQNIDGLEAKAGVTRVVQCHGSFATATCINCGNRVHGEAIKEDLTARRVPLCVICNPDIDLRPKKVRRKKKKKKRNDGWESEEPEEIAPPLPAGIMKPDITFFGEKLSKAFDRKVFKDIKSADLLIVMGTSLKVRPVSEIISHMPHQVYTIVINKTPLPHCFPDYQLLGDADVVVKHLARKLGWNLEPERNINGGITNGQPEPSSARPARPVRMKETGRSKTNVTVVGTSGVLLFKGAEGGKYVDDLIAERNSRNSRLSDVDVVTDIDLTDSSESDDMDSDSDRASKRPRMSL